MDGAVCGRARWIGPVPRGTVDIAVSPLNRPGPFGFRIDAIEGPSRLRLALRGLRRRPNIAIVAIGARLINARDVAHRWLQAALCPTSFESYDEWIRKFLRAPEVNGIDAPRAKSMKVRIRLIIDRNQSNDQALQTTLQSLKSQIFPHWTLHPIGAKDCHHAGRQNPRDEDGRISAVDDALTSFADDDLCALIKAGDILPAHALAGIAEIASNNPELVAVYGDEDSQSKDGALHSPVFRPDWSPILQELSPYLGPLLFVRVDALKRLAVGLDDLLGERIYSDAALAAPVEAVKHIRRVLYRRVREKAEVSTSLDVMSAKSQETPRVAIIIPTRDRTKLLSRCVDGLIHSTDYSNFEVVIVDNGSTEPEAVRLLQSLRDRDGYTVLDRPESFNYSKLCNDGVAASDAPILVFLNNDIAISNPGWLRALITWAARPDVGAVGAKLLYPNRPFRNRVQHVGVALGLFGIASHTYYYAAADERGYLWSMAAPHEISAVSGACMAVARAKFIAVGGFDAENLPIDLNDIDFCLRLGAKGWRCLFTPEAVLYHAESATRGKTVYAAARYAAERDYFIKRWLHIMRDDPYFHPAFSRYSKRIRLA
jgi:GT2 family glycosyltransferase